ncbi:MAG: alpha/beta hydrolase [Anaerolineae bacterium]|nr:alpha/beta hydrolase [Anaerolineae bacterium]
MSFALLDNPQILSVAFYPRRARPDDGYRAGLPGVVSGLIPVAEGVDLGYRLYAHRPGAPLILHFHGNAEIAPDYDDLAVYVHSEVDASLLVVDYRGFGWSTGNPTFAALIDDCAPVVAALPAILAGNRLPADTPLVIMGRSMGSVPALHIAHSYADRFRAVIIDSGFADLPALLVRMGVPRVMLGVLSDPLGNERKARELRLPLLVIHGEEDMLIPVEHGQRLYDACPHPGKAIFRVPGAGHNDVLAVAPEQYFETMRIFLSDVRAPGSDTP